MTSKRRSGIPVADVPDDEIAAALDLGIEEITGPLADPYEQEIADALDLGIQEATGPLQHIDDDIDRDIDALMAEATAVPGTIEDEISDALESSFAAITVPPVADGDTPVGSPPADGDD